ncbi:MAG: hypothetical protein QXG86_04010 [Candidatus Woesearchaeota archaeon]
MVNNKIIYLNSFLVALLFLVIIHEKPTITTLATYATSPEVKSVIDVLAQDNSLKLLGEGAPICIVVEIDNQTTYYFNISRRDNFVSVEEKYCADPDQDNIIIKFNSYEDLLLLKSNPQKFIKEKRNKGYYIFPSNFVKEGGEVACDYQFQKNYCPPLYYHFNKREIAETTLVCCANYELTEEEKALIKSLKKEKLGILEAPLEFITTPTGVILVTGGILFIIILTALIIIKPKNPLLDYVSSAKRQGFSEEQIKQALIEGGWDEATVNEALSLTRK